VAAPAERMATAGPAIPPDREALALGLKAGDWGTAVPGLAAVLILLVLVLLRRRGALPEHLRRRSGMASLQDIIEPLAQPGDEVSRLTATTLEDLPEIRDRIVALWGTPESLAYLENLLQEGRVDPQKCLSLSVVQELLFLIDLLAARETA
jgi:hypothetical protein